MDLKDFCITLQQDLNDLAGNNFPAYKREATGFLDSLVSTENTTGIPEPLRVDAGDGKRKQVIVRYLTPGLLSEVSNTDTNICTNEGIEEVHNTLLKDVDRFRRSPVLTFTKDELRNLCEGPSEHRANVVATKMSSVFRSINQDLIALANTGVGSFFGAVAAGKQINLLAKEGLVSAADPNGEFVVREDMANLGIMGRPIVVGAGKVAQYSHLAGIGCCNQYGQQIDQMSNWAYYRDQDLGSITGNADDFLAYAPGALQMIKWNLNKGEFEMNDTRSVESTIIDPVTGIELDYDMYYDRCDKVYKMYFYLNYGLFVLPTDMYKVGDDRAGTNNLFKYRALEAIPV